MSVERFEFEMPNGDMKIVEASTKESGTTVVVSVAGNVGALLREEPHELPAGELRIATHQYSLVADILPPVGGGRQTFTF